MSETNEQLQTVDQAPEIRVFISSTFRDMQDEREYLLKHIFPELRQICRDRGVQFTEIDLRWGVTREEAEQGKVLKICLDEINRCRPYFIGILGERYGWTPRLEDVRKDAELVDEHPWIEGAINDNISVTEMEILYGVLDNPSMEERAFFYFRDAEVTLPQFKETESTLQHKLLDLKNRIRAGHYPVHENFQSPEALGLLVREDLLRIINEIYPAEEAPSPLERERRIHEAFALTRRGSYVARQEYLDLLDAQADGEEQPLVVIGEPGSGKSALLAYWVHEYRRRHPDVFVIEHYIGATSSGGGHLGVIGRIMEEIKDRYDLPEEVPATPEEMEREFPAWLAKVQKERMILIVDALNQLSGQSNEVRWLPRHVPPNVRAFFSTISGTTRRSLAKRGWREMLVDLLTEEEREKLIRHYLGKFRKALSPEQRAVIAADPKCANPLFLRTVLEELRIFGSFERLDEKINYYVSAADVSDLFQRVLNRLEEDYGRELVEVVMTLIWGSRRGLSEAELIEMTGLSRMALSVLLLALEYQLMQRDGLLDFYHDFLRDAVDTRYYQNGEGGAAERYHTAHIRIADYFDGQEISPRKADELPWQLQEAGETERLKQALGTIPMFLQFAPEEKQYALLGYWLYAADLAVMEEMYGEAVKEYVASDEEQAAALKVLGTFLIRSGRYKTAEIVIREALTLYEQIQGPHTEDLVTCLDRLAILLLEIGNYAESRKTFERELEICEEHFGRTSLETADTQYGLAQLMRTIGNYSEAERLFRQALEIRTTNLSSEHPQTGICLSNLAALLDESGQSALAEPMFRQVIEIHDKGLGELHPQTADAIYNLGTLLYTQGNYDEAEPLFQKALAIWKKIFGDEHPATAMGINNLAVLYRNKGDLQAAEPLYRQTLDIWHAIFGPEHLYSAMTLTNIAELLQDKRDFDGAESLYIEARSVYQKAVGESHPYVAYAVHGLGTLYRDRGDAEGAEREFLSALEIRRAALGDHPETAETLEEYGKILRAMERLAEATAVEGELQELKARIG